LGESGVAGRGAGRGGRGGGPGFVSAPAFDKEPPVLPADLKQNLGVDIFEKKAIRRLSICSSRCAVSGRRKYEIHFATDLDADADLFSHAGDIQWSEQRRRLETSTRARRYTRDRGLLLAERKWWLSLHKKERQGE
jgi:hypothetical protein